MVREEVIGHRGCVGRRREGLRDPHLWCMLLRTCVAKATSCSHHEVGTALVAAVHATIQASTTLVAA